MDKYLSLVINAIRLWGILLVGGFSLMHGQTLPKDSAKSMEIRSKALLATEVYFNNSQKSLSESLRELVRQHKINIVFSESVLGNATTKLIPYAKRSVQQILELLLAGTEFDYLVIGQTVAIVTAPPKNNELPKDSNGVVYRSHIIRSSPQSFDHIPAKERRMMRRILLQELDRHQLMIVEKKDTTIVIPVQSFPITKVFGLIGLPIYTMRQRSLHTDDWKKDLSYKASVPIDLSVKLGLEIHQKQYFVSIGIALQRLHLQTDWIDSADIPPAEVPPAPIPKPKYKSALDKYLILSIPVSIGYNLRYKNHTFSPMLGIQYSYVDYGKPGPKKFEKYYKKKNPKASYIERVYHHLLGAGIGLNYNYQIDDRWSFKSNLEYSLFLNPLAYNSLFKTYSPYFSFYLGVAYALD